MHIRVLSAALAALLAVGALAGCTASGGASASGESAAKPAAAAGGASSAKAAAADRAVVKTGTLRLVADHPVEAAGRVTALVEAAAGSVATADETPSGDASARLTLRIPAGAFDRTLTAIERQGHVRDVSIGTTDVTARVTDYGVRIANLRTSIARLQHLLSAAASSSALVEIESALTDRQGTLEQLLAQQRTLADQVTYATLTVSILPPAAAPRQGPTDFLGGLVAGLGGLVTTAGALAIGLGVVLPWLVVLAALGGGALGVVRVLRRRTRATSV